MNKLIIILALLIASPLYASQSELEAQIIQAGYKGLHEHGLAKFLYDVKHGDSLRDGLNKVFWSDISDKAKKADALFEASQAIDGYIVYELMTFNDDEDITFTIAVPADKDEIFLTGQQLRDRCHAFADTITFGTASGGSETIPLFKPVNTGICAKN